MPELDLEENNPLLPPSQINDENYEGSIFGEDARFVQIQDKFSEFVRI